MGTLFQAVVQLQQSSNGSASLFARTNAIGLITLSSVAEYCPCFERLVGNDHHSFRKHMGQQNTPCKIFHNGQELLKLRSVAQQPSHWAALRLQQARSLLTALRCLCSNPGALHIQ